MTTTSPAVKALQTEWYVRRAAWVDDGSPDSGQSFHSFRHIDKKLTDLLWQEAWDAREADRKAHPKAKRNQPVPARDADHPSRNIP